jgi:hypothetical protein
MATAANAAGPAGLIAAARDDVVLATNASEVAKTSADEANRVATETMNKARYSLSSFNVAVVNNAQFPKGAKKVYEDDVINSEAQACKIASNGRRLIEGAKALLLAAMKKLKELLQMQELFQQQLEQQKQHFERQLAEQKQLLAELAAAAKADAAEKAEAEKKAVAEKTAAEIAALSAEIAKLVN